MYYFVIKINDTFKQVQTFKFFILTKLYILWMIEIVRLCKSMVSFSKPQFFGFDVFCR
jgi:hypothetical protein